MSSIETITVVFTDLVGSTGLATRVGPGAAEELRQEHFALLREGLDHLFMVPGGLVDPFLPALARHPGLKPIVAAHEGGQRRSDDEHGCSGDLQQPADVAHQRVALRSRRQDHHHAGAGVSPSQDHRTALKPPGGRHRHHGLKLSRLQSAEQRTRLQGGAFGFGGGDGQLAIPRGGPRPTMMSTMSTP